MRSMKNRVLRPAIITLLLFIITLSHPSYFADAYMVSSDILMYYNEGNGIAIESYCGSSGLTEIINLGNFCVANKIIKENNCIRIVRDNTGSNKINYAKNTDDE